MSKGIERTHMVAAILVIAVLLVNGFLGAKTSLRLFDALQPYTLLALLVTGMAWLRFNLARRSVEEARALAEEQGTREGTSLFDDADLAPYTLRRTKDQVERYLVPAFAGLLVVLLIGWTWGLAGALRERVPPPAGTDWLMITAFLAGEAFLLFLFSRYLLGLSRHAEYALARGPGIQVGLVSLGTALGAVAALVAHLVNPLSDWIAALILAVGLGALAVEGLLNLILAIYSPRREELLATAYHSRLGGLVTDPAGWVRNFAHAVDYQFGFNVSESWVYQLLQKMLAPLFLGIAAVLYAMSCFVFIAPDELAVREKWGKPLAENWQLESGFHVKAPWPFETIRRVPAKRILSTYVGYEPNPDELRPKYILWTTQHFLQEQPLLVASPEIGSEATGKRASAVGLLTVNVPIEYRVSDLKQYVYGFAHPDRAVQQVCRRILVQELAGRDLNDLLGKGRASLGEALQTRMQAAAKEAGLGVEILFVGLQGVHPPTEVADAFQSVVSAQAERESRILMADAVAASVLPIARAEAAATVWEARGYSTNRVEQSRAEVVQFSKRLDAYRAAPEVFRSEAYLSTLSRTLRGVRKYVVDKHPNEVLTFDFQEKLQPDLFDFSPGETE